MQKRTAADSTMGIGMDGAGTGKGQQLNSSCLSKSDEASASESDLTISIYSPNKSDDFNGNGLREGSSISICLRVSGSSTASLFLLSSPLHKVMEAIREAIEGKIDFKGQRLADRINQETLVFVTVSHITPSLLSVQRSIFYLPSLDSLLLLSGSILRFRLVIRFSFHLSNNIRSRLPWVLGGELSFISFFPSFHSLPSN